MRAPALRVAATGLLVVLAASCSSIDDQLLVVESPGLEQQPTSIWAVEPGDDLDDDRLVVPEAVGPLAVVTRGPRGELLMNRLGRTWRDELLVSYVGESDQRVVATMPGAKGTTITSGSQVEVVVVSRGVFVLDEGGCLLARGTQDAERVGVGRCSISDDDRWIASWPDVGGPLEIRDLRNERVRTIEGSFTQAVALAHDARVLAIETGATTSTAKIIDASSGKVLSSGEPAAFLQAQPAAKDGKGFVVIAERDGIPSLEWIDGDGATTTIAEGEPAQPLLPANVGDGVDYLAMGTEPDDSRLYHWSPGQRPEELLRGELTATALSAQRTLVTRQVDEGLELWSVHDGELGAVPHLVLRTDASQHLQLARVLAMDGVAHVQVLGPGGASYVRVDTEAGHSSDPLKDWTSLSISSIDSDGTVLLAGNRAAEGDQKLMAVGPHDDGAVELARAQHLDMSLMHDGTVYFTTITEEGGSTIWRVPASRRGDGDEPERLWEDALLGGAAWEQFGGASATYTVDPVLIAQQAGSQQGGSQQP